MTYNGVFYMLFYPFFIVSPSRFTPNIVTVIKTIFTFTYTAQTHTCTRNAHLHTFLLAIALFGRTRPSNTWLRRTDKLPQFEQTDKNFRINKEVMHISAPGST